MDLAPYFTPPRLDDFETRYASSPQSVASLATVYVDDFPNWETADIVLFGVEEERGGTGRPGAGQAPDTIRSYLYQLAAPLTSLRLVDLGNLVLDEAPDRVYQRLAEVTEVLLKANKTIVVLGGTQDITYGLYRGWQNLETEVNYVAVDSSPDILDPSSGLHHHSFNNAILTYAPNYLKSFVNLATQSYFVTEGERKALSQLGFETLRIGEMHGNLRSAEPYLREAHLVSFDVSAVRQSDAPGTNHPSPAGLNVEEAAQLARYAGMGYWAQCFCVSEVNPEVDVRHVTSHLASILVWYFIEGFYLRRDDRPAADRTNLVKHTARLHGPVPEIVFYRNKASQRWWMEVPSPQTLNRSERHFDLVPCSQRDYQQALDNEIPTRWWTAHYRFP